MAFSPKRFNKLAERQRREGLKFEGKAVRDGKKIVRELKNRIRDILDDFRGMSVEQIAASRTQLMKRLRVESEKFQEISKGFIQRKTRDGFKDAMENAAAPFSALGLDVRVMIMESTETVGVGFDLAAAIEEFALEIWDKVTPNVMAQTQQVISRAILAGGSASDLLAELSDIFSNKTDAELERVIRTTIGSVQDLAAEQFRQEMHKRHPGMKRIIKKQWLHSGQPESVGGRRGHIMLDQEVRTAGQDFVNPITKERLAFAHDPSAPPGETINCACRTVDFVDPDLKPEDLLDKELERLFA